MIKHIAKPLIATALLSCAQFASAIPLSDLFLAGAAPLTAGNGIMFSDFNLSNDSFDSSSIEVTVGANGLAFNANQSIGLTDFDGSGGFETLWFDYLITAATGHTITGQSMVAELDHFACDAKIAELDGSTCDNIPVEVGFTQLWKEIYDATFTTSLADIIIVAGNATGTGSSASASGTSLRIDDYIEISNSEYESGNVYNWSQDYTQRENQVPAPATLALFALGLLGMGASRRKA